jgi:hypothetical protein
MTWIGKGAENWFLPKKAFLTVQSYRLFRRQLKTRSATPENNFAKMESSKKMRVALGLVIIAALGFSRVSKMPETRTVDMLFLVGGGMCIGALITLLLQKSR